MDDEIAEPTAEERVVELEERWRGSVLQGALALELQRAGCRDVEAALLLLDRAGVAVDDAGAVTGVPEAVVALREARGYLFTPEHTTERINPAGAAPADPGAAFARWLRGN
ncbi:MAG: hypothetical protein WCJ56_01165 [bacterium]